MPLMANKHGRAICVNEEHVQDNLARGLRLLDESDMNYLATEAESFFKVARVQGFSKGQLGKRMIQVRGKGPSWQPAMPDAFVIDINGKRDDDADAVLCIDSVAWDAIDAENVVRFYPKGFHTDKGTHVFTMPVTPAAGMGNSMRLREGKAIRNAHFSGIAAVLVALYLTNGPVVISGFDLSGSDAAGVAYTRQLPAWEAAAKLWQRVFADSKPQGFKLPLWVRDSATEHITCIGGGPSANNVVPQGAIAACNDRIHDYANPLYYWLTDPRAIRMYSTAAEVREEVCGTKIVSWLTHPRKEEGEHVHGRSSGVMLLRAVLQDLKPKRVTLLGYDGYEEGQTIYQDGTKRRWRTGMNEAMARALKRIFDEYPDVDFVWHCEGPLKEMVEAL